MILGKLVYEYDYVIIDMIIFNMSQSSTIIALIEKTN